MRPKQKLPLKPLKRPRPIEEVTFDPDARQDYLTGFHKRKVQRIKHAQEQAAKEAKEQKIEARKQLQLREQRKKDLEQHVETVNTMLRKAERGFVDSDDEGVAEVEDVVQQPVSNASAVAGHEEEFIDEDKLTTVTIEPMDLNGADEEPDSSEDAAEDASEMTPAVHTTKMKPLKRIWSKTKPQADGGEEEETKVPIREQGRKVAE
ncbi:hypothetical protein MRB53_039886 [Persea americana]|nr:hypothetical protein MRB53_039886 [Persea americana]